MNESGKRDFILLIIAILAFTLLGTAAGGRRMGVPEESEQIAIDHLEEVLSIMENTEQYGGDLTYDDVCDDILDGIRGAIAVLEKS